MAADELVRGAIMFMLGLGLGLAVVRLGKWLLVALAIGILLPYLLPALGLQLPGIDVLTLLRRVIEAAAGFIAGDRYALMGFGLGLAISLLFLVAELMRRR